MRQCILVRFLCGLFGLSTLGVAGIFLALIRTQTGTLSGSVLNLAEGTAVPCRCDVTSALADKRNRNETQQQVIDSEPELETPTGPKNYTPVSQGYIVALRHYEQQTQAFKNYLQLQCLADSYGLRTVEPFLERSFLSFPLESLLMKKNVMVLGDLVDVDLWNKEVKTKYGYQMMASWDEFLHFAPRSLVIGCIQYQNPPNLHVPLPGSDYRLGCRKECFSKIELGLRYLKQYGFTVVREACANFYDYAGAVTPESFLENLLRRHKPEQTTIVLNEFRGFFGIYRLPLLSNCGIIHHNLNISVMPSARIMKDSRQYISEHFQGKPYIAIMVRMERIVLHLHWNVTECAKELMDSLEQFHAQSNLSRNYFLAMDVGQYGSQSSVNHGLLPHGKAMFNSIFKSAWSFEEWEDTFKRFIHPSNSTDVKGMVNSDAGYIANIQRVIAAQSDCLVIVGGGGFQAQAKVYYRVFHSDQQNDCLIRVCMHGALGRTTKM